MYDALHDVIFTSNYQFSEVDVISARSASIVARIPLNAPTGLDITADGRTLIVGTDTHSFYRIDTSSLCVLAHVELTGIATYLSPTIPLALADGSVVFALRDVQSSLSGLAIWSPATGTRMFNTGYSASGRVLLSGDRKHLYVSEGNSTPGAVRYDVATGAFTNIQYQDNQGTSVFAANYDGSRIYLQTGCCGMVVVDANLQKIAALKPNPGNGYFLSPDGSVLTGPNLFGDNLQQLDAATLQTLGYFPVQAKAFSPAFGNGPFANSSAYDGSGRLIASTSAGVLLVSLSGPRQPTPELATVSANGLSSNNIESGTTPSLDYYGPSTSGVLAAITPAAVTFSEAQQAKLAAYSTTSNYYGTSLALTAPSFPSGCADVTATFNIGTGLFLPSAFCYGPIVTSVAGDAGPSTGGGQLVLYGEGFSARSVVRIGGVPVSGTRGFVGSTVYDTETYTVTVPPGTPGTADISVTNALGTTFTLPAAYTYFVRQDAALPAAAKPAVLLHDAIHNRLLWTDSGRNMLVVSSPVTGQTLQEIPVGPGPLGLSLSPDATRIAVASTSDRLLTLYDAVTFVKLQSASLPVFNFVSWTPQQVAIMKNGKALIAAANDNALSGGYDFAGFFTWDLATNVVSGLNQYLVGARFCENFADIASSADGTVARVGNMVYYAQTDKFVLADYSAASCTRIGLSADGAVAADLGFIGDAPGRVQNFYSAPARIASKDSSLHYHDGSSVDALAVNSSGSLAYMAYATSYSALQTIPGIRVFDLGHGTLTRSLSLPGGFSTPYFGHPMVADPAGQNLWIFTPGGLSVLHFLADPLAVGELSLTGSILSLRGSGFTPAMTLRVDQQLISGLTLSGTQSATAPLPVLPSGPHSVILTIPGQHDYVLPAAFVTP